MQCKVEEGVTQPGGSAEVQGESANDVVTVNCFSYQRTSPEGSKDHNAWSKTSQEGAEVTEKEAWRQSGVLTWAEIR